MISHEGKLTRPTGDTVIRPNDRVIILALNDKVQEVEQMFREEFFRIRDIREGPDGSIYFLAVGNNALFRITPR